MRLLQSLALCLSLTTLAALHAVRAAPEDPDKLPVTRIRDLHYGDVLFYVYQDESFEAITRLNAYEHWKLLPDHQAEAQLLLGGLYLSLGLHNEAGRRFEALLTPDIPAGVRNRAWFYLGKVWYARGYLDQAEHALRQIGGRLIPSLEAERQLLLANILMRQGKFAAAGEQLAAWQGPADWTVYARFNLGVALVRQGRLAEAAPYLNTAGTIETASQEMLALRDRANLALGFAYLQANQPAEAKTALERVRLNGPYSSKALLGTGWAESALGKFQDALTPWLELRGRSLLDSAVQESYLAVPYAYARLSANAQAADEYEKALSSFDAERTQLDASIERVRGGGMLDALLGADKDRYRGWFWQLTSVPQAPESRYLYTVLAGHDFQEGLKNYRDLSFLSGTLDRWSGSMDAFENMIDARNRAYAQRVPRADALLATNEPDEMLRHHAELASRLDEVSHDADFAALGSSEERAQWAKLQRLEADLAAAPHDAANDALRERLRLVKGVLYFRMSGSFKEREWEQRKNLRALQAAVREAQSRWVRLSDARKLVTGDTGAFEARLADLHRRIASLQMRLAAASSEQNAYLERLAIAELNSQKERIETYQVQARFALATIYDRISNEARPAKDAASGAAPATQHSPAPAGEAPP